MLRRVALLAALALSALALAAPATAAAQSFSDVYGPVAATPRASEPSVPPRVEGASQAAAGAALPTGAGSTWRLRGRTADEARSPDRAKVEFLPAKPARRLTSAPTPSGADGEPLSPEELDNL